MSKLLEEPMSITSTPEDIRAEIAPTIFDGFPRVAGDRPSTARRRAPFVRRISGAGRVR